jgi:hypothetical protein
MTGQESSAQSLCFLSPFTPPWLSASPSPGLCHAKIAKFRAWQIVAVDAFGTHQLTAIRDWRHHSDCLPVSLCWAGDLESLFCVDGRTTFLLFRVTGITIRERL